MERRIAARECASISHIFLFFFIIPRFLACLRFKFVLIACPRPLLATVHHSCAGLALLQTCGVLSGLSKDDAATFRKLFLSAILATDMQNHRKLLADVASRVASCPPPLPPFHGGSFEERTLLVSCVPPRCFVTSHANARSLCCASAGLCCTPLTSVARSFPSTTRSGWLPKCPPNSRVKPTRNESWACP